MNKIALITGASSGFGLEFARIFAKNGYDIALTSRHEEDLTSIEQEIKDNYGVRVWYKTFDLSEPGAAHQLYDWTQQHKLKISVLVNNAGIGLYGHFADHDLQEEVGLINLNVTALTELCHLYLPSMIKQKQGKILNVASIAAFHAGPYYATYFASKAYVLLFSEALQSEYQDKNIQVTALCPGVSKTGFFKRAGMREDAPLLRGYMMTAQQVVEAGYKGLMAGKPVVIPGLRNKFISLGYRVFPRKTITKITKNLIHSNAK